MAKKLLIRLAIGSTLQSGFTTTFTRTDKLIKQLGDSLRKANKRNIRTSNSIKKLEEKRLALQEKIKLATASGDKIPVLTVLKSDGDNYSFSQVSRDTYTGVTAYWVNPRKSKRHKVVYGTIGNAKQMRETFTNENDVLEVAKAEYQRLKHGESTMRFSMAVGNPVLSPQYVVKFPNMKPPINEIEWLVKSITHKLDDSGLTTDLELELTGSEEEDG